MFKKVLLLLVFLIPLSAFGQTINAGISVDVNKSDNQDVQNFVQKLPKIEKDFVDLNYSIELKNIDILSDDDFVLDVGANVPNKVLRTNYVSAPLEYEVSLGVGSVEGKDNSMNTIEYLIQKDPNNRELLFAYSIQLKKENKLTEALQAAQKAVDIDPDYALGHFLKGDILRQMAKFKEAVDEYLYTTQINPYCADAYYNIAKILEILDDRDLAFDYYKMAYQANPNDKELMNIIMDNYIEL